MPQDSKNTTSKIAVILPSRGMMMSKTMESVFNNIYGKEAKLFMAHGIPLPMCFNYAIQKALLEYDPDYLWFVEEDMLIPDGTLDTLLASGEPVCGVDYADRRTGRRLSYFNKSGKCLYTGMGCLLVKREVMDKLPIPWVKTMVFWIVDTDDGDTDYVAKPDLAPTGYGSQDLYLCDQIRKLGYEIKINREIQVGHMELKEKGQDVKNYGVDNIETIYITEDKEQYEKGELGTETLTDNAPRRKDDTANL